MMPPLTGALYDVGMLNLGTHQAYSKSPLVGGYPPDHSSDIGLFILPASRASMVVVLVPQSYCAG